jgi:hypothetical protein
VPPATPAGWPSRSRKCSAQARSSPPGATPPGEIGSISGPTASIPSAALRAAHLTIVGSGQGSVTTREILAELPTLAQQITNGTFGIDARPTPLADVEQAWAGAAHTAQRIVLTPGPGHAPPMPPGRADGCTRAQ